MATREARTKPWSFSGIEGACFLLLALTRWPAQAADRGILEVDPLNGAATLRVPLGPGIGRPGLRFVPALVGTFAPLVTPSGGASEDPGPSLLGASGFELSPGSLQVWLGPEDGPGSFPRAQWTFPDGSGGGTRGGSTTGVTAKALWAAFGQTPAPEACPDPWLLSGQGGEVLVALPPAAAEAALFPARMLVVRGEQGVEYEREEANEAHPADPRSARYRLAAIRAEAGEAVTFTYGPDGLDFEAAWGTAKVQVTRDLEARLNVTYGGPEAIPGYTLTGSGGRPGGPNALMRVDRAEGAERIEFRCAEAPALNQAGRSTGPMVVRDIILPGRTLRLDWEAQPDPWRAAGTGPVTWCYGVRAVHDLAGDGLESPGETYLRPARVEPGQTWVRQSRHFALARDPGAEAPCRTHVRDRWQFRWEVAGDPEWPCPDGESDIPTLERDPKTGALVPVPGLLTRWLNWGPEGPPDPHGDPRPSGGGRMRLLGGMPKEEPDPKPSAVKAPDTPNPSAAPVTFEQPRYNPAKGEVTLGVVVGAAPSGPGQGTATGPGAGSSPGGGAGGLTRPSGTGTQAGRTQGSAAQISAYLQAQQRAIVEESVHRQTALALESERLVREPIARLEAANARAQEQWAEQTQLAQERVRIADNLKSWTETQRSRLDNRVDSMRSALMFRGMEVETRATHARQELFAAEQDAGEAAWMAADCARKVAEAQLNAAEAERSAMADEQMAAEVSQETADIQRLADETEREAAEAMRRVAEMERETAEILRKVREPVAARKRKQARWDSYLTGIPLHLEEALNHPPEVMKGMVKGLLDSIADLGKKVGKTDAEIVAAQHRCVQAPLSRYLGEKKAAGKPVNEASGSNEAKAAVAKWVDCTDMRSTDPEPTLIPIVRGEDGNLKFDVGPIRCGPAPGPRAESKAPTQMERAEAIHAWVNEAATKGIFDRTNGVQDQEGFTAFLGEFNPWMMKFPNYHGKYEEFLAGHMPGRAVGQILLGAGLLPTAIPPTGPKAIFPHPPALKGSPPVVQAKAPTQLVDTHVPPPPRANFKFGHPETPSGPPLTGIGNLPRPNGVPDTWRIVEGQSHGHIKFVNPNNSHDYVRVKPDGTVTQVRNGMAYDKKGNRVPLRSPAAHSITANKFIFREE